MTDQQQGREAARTRTCWGGAWLPVACCWSLFLTGCFTRSLTIRTDPPGALVYVNDQFKGTSPVTYDFLWYGWHRVILRKEGFERLEDRKELRAPASLWIPFDLAVELLPFPVRDVRAWSFALTSVSTPPSPTPPAILSPASNQPESAATRPEPAPSPDVPAGHPSEGARDDAP